MNQSTLDRVIEHIAKMNPKRHILVEANTEIYKQLGIYGDDFVFDLLKWVEREFGVRPDITMSDYVPCEQNFFRERRFLRHLLRLPERQFKSLKVRDVVAAIERNSWQSDENLHV